MPIYLDSSDRGDLPETAPIARPVQPVEHPIGAGGAEQFRELTPVEAAAAFFAEFDRVLARIRANHQIVQRAQLTHDSDGVLRPVMKVAR